jgi:hypothetical protein
VLEGLEDSEPLTRSIGTIGWRIRFRSTMARRHVGAQDSLTPLRPDAPGARNNYLLLLIILAPKMSTDRKGTIILLGRGIYFEKNYSIR